MGYQASLGNADVDIRAEFSSTEAFLKEKKLPQVILDRHTQAVSDYDANFKKLKGDLEGIFSLEDERKEAKGKKDDATADLKVGQLKKLIKDTKDDLEEKVKKPRHDPLDPNNLPHRSPKPNNKKPRLKKEEFADPPLADNKPIQLAYNGERLDLLLASHTPGGDLPTAADLEIILSLFP